MRIAIVSAILLAAGTAAASPVYTTVKLFDPTLGETPESINFDHRGSKIISLALTGEVRRIAPDGTEDTLAHLPLSPWLTPCGNAFGVAIMGGVALDPQDNVYVSVAPCDASAIGIYRIPADGGTPTRIAALPPDALPNGIAYRAGQLYVADTNLGRIWRVAADGSSTTVWSQDPGLAPLPDFFPGPNGLQIFRDEVYVSVSDHFYVLAFPIRADGSAGPPRVHATGVGLDDFAFDTAGNLYGTTDPFNTLVRISPAGVVDVLLDASNGIDGPTSCAFGVLGDNQALYVNNAAFPFFSVTHRPSIMRVQIGTPGQPR